MCDLVGDPDFWTINSISMPLPTPWKEKNDMELSGATFWQITKTNKIIQS